MKAGTKILALWLAIFAGLLGATNKSLAQVTVSLTPSVTNNNYTGFLTLQISGVNPGETVKVLTFLDLNSNGVVDAGEPMIGSFSITDNGTDGLFGGVTNVNVPRDHNTTNGVITTTLNIAPPITLANVVGQQIFQVTTSAGQFTATYKVTNAPAGQSVSGTVFSGATPLANAVVVATVLPNMDYAGATVSDGSGHYSLSLNPGNYVMLTARPNFYTDQSIAPQFTLSNGVSLMTNLFLTNGLASNTISGQVFDSVSSNGIGGVFVQLQSGNLFAVTFTDANGNYSATVKPGILEIKPGKETLARTAYVTSDSTFQVNATSGSVTNASFPLYKGNALFYGHITDNFNTPLANVAFDANDNNNQYGSKGYSDANGNYAAAVLSLTNDPWNCNPNASEVLTNYILNNFLNTNVTNGQVVLQNFTALPITAHITGQVHDNLGNPVVSVAMYASSTNGTYQSQNFNTDNSENYSLGVTTGVWFVGFSLGGENGLDTAGFADLTGPHPVSIPPTNAALNLIVYPLSTPLISQAQRFSPSQFGFNVTGSVGVTYTLQVSTNLASTNWSSLFSFQITNNPFLLVDPNATNSPRYYRVKKGP